MTISHLTREEGAELYIIDGLTFDEVAKETEVAPSTLKIWASEEGWQERRREYRRAARKTQTDILKLRQRLFEAALENCDPQTVYAAVRLESVAAKQAPKQERAEPDIDRPKLFLENMEFIAETLKDVDPEGLKVFARHFETIIEKFKQAQA